MPRRHLLLYRSLLVLCLIAVTYFAVTGERYPIVSQVNDKLAHTSVFYLLALLLDFSFPASALNGAKIATLIAYGALLEAVQSATPERDPSLWDLLADSAGIAFYAASLPVLKRIPLLARRWQTGS